MEEVTAALLSNEMRKKSVEAESQANELVVRGRTVEKDVENKNRSRSKSKGRFQKTCYYCKKKRHVIKDCYKLKGKEKTSDTVSVQRIAQI